MTYQRFRFGAGSKRQSGLGRVFGKARKFDGTPSSEIAAAWLFPLNYGLNSIRGDGWTGYYSNSPTFDPIGAPETFTVTRRGFDASAAPVTVNDTITIMKRLRQPHPSQGLPSATEVVLSDYIYQGDIVAGVVNNSNLVAPLPIAMWLDSDLSRATGQIYTARLAVDHMYARNGRPVAAVKFVATDGTTTVEQVVSAMSKADYTATGLSVPHFAATLNLSTLTANVLVKVYAIIYPWAGAAYNIDTQGAAYPSSNLTSLRVLNDNGSYGTAYAYTSPSGNDGTAVVSATPAVAQALPYLTTAAAAAAIKVFNNANYGRNNTSGGHIRQEVGTQTISDFSSATSGDLPLVIEAANPANKSTTIFRDSGANIDPSIPAAVKFKDLTIKRNASGSVIFLSNGSASSRLIFDGCTMDASGFGPSWGAYIYQCAFVTVINCDGDEMGFATGFGTDKKQVNAIGSTHSLGNVTYNLAGCKSLNVALVDNSLGVGSREASIGRFVGFCFLGNDGAVAEIFAHNTAIGAAGLALVGNIFEVRAGSYAALILLEANVAGQNLLLHGNNFLGQRTIYAYNDTGFSLKSGSVKFNVFDAYNSKSDVFGSNGAYVGNWSVVHKVAARANALLYGDSNADAFGVGQWAGEFAALGEVIGTNAVPVVADFVSDRSSRGTAAGDGNYTPGASTALPFIPAGQSLYAWDLYGNAISDSGTSRIGARMAAASGAQTLVGTLHTEADTFGAGTIVRGTVTVTGALFTEADAFGAGVIAASYAITGALFSEADTFGAGAAVVGAVTLAGTLFNEADTFGAGAIIPGAVTTVGTLYSEADSFGAGAVSIGAVILAGALYSEADTFGAGSIAIGAVTIGGALFSEADTFGAGAIVQAGGAQTLVGTVYSEVDSFGAGVVVAGTVTLGGTLFSEADTFGAGAVIAAGSPQTLTGTLFAEADAFGAGAIATSAITLTGTLFAEADTFGAGVVQRGSVAILGTLFAEADTFGAGAIVVGPSIILGALFAETDFFGAGNIFVPGSYDSGFGSFYTSAPRLGQIINGRRDGAIINQIRSGRVKAGHQ